MADDDIRHLGGQRQQIVDQAAVHQLPLLAVETFLIERAADTLHDAAAYLFVHQHRVDDGAAVLHAPVLEQLDEAGFHIDLHQACLNAVAEGEAVLARRVVPGDGQLGLEFRRQRVRAEIGDAPELRQRQFRFERQPVDDLVADDIEFGPACAEYMGRHVEDVRAQRPSRLQHRLAADAGAARGPGAAAVGRHPGVTGDHPDFVDGDADCARGDLRERPFGALPLLADARQAGHHAGRIEAQRGAVLGRDPGAADAVESRRGVGDFDHRGKPDAAVDAPLPQLRLFGAQLRVVHEREQLVERLLMRQALELESGGEAVRVGVIRNQVAAPEFRRVDAELLRGEIDDALGDCHSDRMADAAILAGDVLVGEHHVHLRAVLLVLIRAAGEVDHLVAFDAAGARIDRIGADGGEVPQVEREDLALFGARHAHARLVFARMDVGEEGLEPVGDELDRPAQHHRNRRGCHLVRVDVHLDAERPADVLADHAHVGLGNVEVARENVLHHVRRLGRLVHRQRVFRRVIVGEDRTAFQRDAGVAAEGVGLLDHQVGLRERLVDRVGAEVPPEADVIAKLRMDDVLAGERLLHVDHHRKLLPFGLHQLQGVFALCAAFGDDRPHRLALPARALDRERVLRRRLDAFQMAEHRDPGLAVFGHRAPVEHRDHAWLARCF